MNTKKLLAITPLLFIIVISYYFVGSALFRLSNINVSDGSFPTIDRTKSFSVIVLPDTQFYSSIYPEILCQQNGWIAGNIDKLNIVFVSQLGDIVNGGTKNNIEWQNAKKCLGKLDGVVPYSIVPGNHDLDIPGDKASGFFAFDRTFPASIFEKYPWYRGYYESNRNSYEIVKVNGIELLFLNLEIEPSDAVLAWANGVVSSNPNLYSILVTHKYLPDDSNKRDNTRVFGLSGNSGQDIWDKLVNNNCSIKMVLSGHYHNKDGENRIDSRNSCGQIVREVEQDYQVIGKGGDGWLRVYVFTPSRKIIEVYTYSPFLNRFQNDRDSRFVMTM